MARNRKLDKSGGSFERPENSWDQCHAGFWSDVITPDVVEWVGEENILWEGDYLHTIATFPQSQKIISESLGKITDEAMRAKILAGNSVKLFGLNR